MSVAEITLLKYGLVLFLIVHHTKGYQSILLDVAEDIFFSWKVRGDYMYYPKGSKLVAMADKLPADFKFKTFYNTPGIWAIIPNTNDSDNNNNTNTTINATILTSATFSFRSSAQLFSSVSVQYNMRGNGSKIYIRNNKNANISLFEITAPSDTPSYYWINTGVPLDISGQFVVDCEVSEPGDYILIDRVEGFYLETTTSTLRPKTSKPPTPLPYSSACQHLVNLSLAAFSVILAFMATAHAHS